MSAALVVHVIQHNLSGFCLFKQDNGIIFKEHPVSATYYSSIEDCLKRFNTLGTEPYYNAYGNQIKRGYFSIVQVAVSAYTRFTNYSISPVRDFSGDSS